MQSDACLILSKRIIIYCMNRIGIWYAAIVFVLFFCGCSQPGIPEGSEMSDPDTVKSHMLQISTGIDWTAELEPDFLSRRKKNSSDRFASVQAVSGVGPVALYLFPEDYIYPELPGFGSLDITSLEPDLESVLKEFCSRLVLWYNARLPEQRKNLEEDLAGYFVPIQTYMLTAFLYNTQDISSVTGYIYGTPFSDGSYRQIPVRFSNADGWFDVQVFFTRTASGWQIEQVQYGAYVNE